MNIYVSNLQHYFNDQDLHDLFASFGGITSSKVIIDRYTNSSRGFGFIEMDDNVAAQAAIDGLNGKVIDGKAIAVSVAREREEKPRYNNGYSNRY